MIVAQVILDKLPNVKTVVNKLHEIDSVYRNFELEIIAGDPNTIVKCRESKATFQFDFAKVYWNPRLSIFIEFYYFLSKNSAYSGTERERIVEFLHPNDFVFDVFAGVGPFVVPALMLGCTVYANDLNPECFKWMNINLKKNQPKKSSKEYHIFNLDGREFLRTIALPRIESYQKEKHQSLSENKIVILMNLPELALTFLDVFSQWLSTNIEEKEQWILPIHIYCYTFSRADDHVEDIRMRLKTILPEINTDEISCRFVRQVAPNKDMMCVNIKLFDKEKKDNEDITVKRFKSNSSE
jgi:tRNA (guanine37-N1)-methyltransferase